MGSELEVVAQEKLARISVARRAAVAANRDGLAIGELNASVPEIDLVEVDNSAGAGEERDTLRVIAWNMERGRHWQAGAELVRTDPRLGGADVVFLGEMDLGMARSGNVHTTREFAQALGMNYAYGVEFVELTGGEEEERELYPGENEAGYHGNAILSRYLLKDVRLLRLPGGGKWYRHYQQRLGGRMALLATARVGDSSIVLVSTHLESGTEKADADLRVEQARVLAAAIRDYAGERPVLFGGDLNTLAKSPPLVELESVGLDFSSSNDYSKGTAQCVKEGRIVLRPFHIDYLAVRGMEVVGAPGVVLAALPAAESGRLLGDHAVVVADVELRGG